MSIYKDCDIRGIYNEEFCDETAYDIGRAVGTIMKGKKVVVSGDVRVSTEAIKKKLLDGLYDSGTHIIDLGMTPTPVFYYAKQLLGAEGGVMVTASHNPAEYNGFKVVFGDRPVTPEDIKRVERIIREGSFAKGQGQLEKADVLEEYVQMVKSHTKKHRDLRIVIDAGNGTVSKIGPGIFRELGYEVIELFCEYDGSFPNREPNPAVYKHLAQAQRKVLDEQADLGVAFDGDGDRVVFIDEKGRVAVSEESFVVFIREYLRDNPSSVVYDLKSSSIVEREIRKYHSEPIMERSGHAFIKKTFLENDSVLAGEISGHFFFRELGHDDGIYAAVKMAEIIGKQNCPFSSILDGIQKTIITPDIRIPYPTDRQDEMLKRVEALREKYPVSRLDGIRVQFPKGWLLVRKSVTEAGITIRIEADSHEEMAFIKGMLFEAAPELDGKHELLRSGQEV
ncbi:MAG: phosphomannomutase/phosphoglucomutase [Clostridia bacterium]|jgi:phosphomannomutase/phosphoglucomutase